jgi:Uma2 family endonuclease
MAIRPEELPHFDVDRYLRFIEVDPDLAGTELVDGVIYNVSPQSFLHIAAVRRIAEGLNALYPGRVYPGGSVRFSSSLWEPDVWALAADAAPEESAGTYPVAADLQMAVEVSITTNARDLGPKYDEYAAAGVPVYWMVQPEQNGWLVVHKAPQDGRYAVVQRVELPNGYRDITFRQL